MELNKTQISERIFNLMHDLKCNQKEFAKILQITQPAVSKYLSGRIPPANVLLKLAQLSNTSIEWILTGKTFSKSGFVAESIAGYHVTNRLTEEIQSLPEAIKIQITNLINEIHKIVKL
jgi:transcriptional regulator with XRE-family HTH domain